MVEKDSLKKYILKGPQPNWKMGTGSKFSDQ